LSQRLNRAAWIFAFAAAAAGAHCSRDTDLAREDAGSHVLPPATTAPPVPEAGIPRLDAGLAGDAFAPCSERIDQPACRGSNDLPCNAEGYVTEVVRDCFYDAGCAKGFLVLDIGDGGCFEGIGMDQPSEPFTSCIVQAVGSSRCPCPATTVTRYLGSTLEFRQCQ
jgi:hypothetical protein